jgi:hypothetical protein
MSNAHKRDRTVVVEHHWVAEANPDLPVRRHDGIPSIAGASF